MSGNIHIRVGDITTIKTDVIVNAANYRLLGGGGVDGAIHKAGGKEILEECKVLRETQYPDGLPTGEATITTAGDLKAKYIVHTVGPVYRSNNNPEEALKSCYKNSLLLADSKECVSIAFPAIATGIYGYPVEQASKIAYETVSEVLEEYQFIQDVVFIFFSQKDKRVFCNVNNLKCSENSL